MNSLEYTARKWYKHRLNAWRIKRSVGADGIAAEERTQVYADEPCIIFRGGGHAGVGRRAMLSPDAFAEVPDMRESYALYAAPEVVFEANDEVEITYIGGRVYGNTSASFVYPSHSETVVNVQRRA